MVCYLGSSSRTGVPQKQSFKGLSQKTFTFIPPNSLLHVVS